MSPPFPIPKTFPYSPPSPTAEGSQVPQSLPSGERWLVPAKGSHASLRFSSATSSSYCFIISLDMCIPVLRLLRLDSILLHLANRVLPVVYQPHPRHVRVSPTHAVPTVTLLSKGWLWGSTCSLDFGPAPLSSCIWLKFTFYYNMWVPANYCWALAGFPQSHRGLWFETFEASSL